VIREVTGIRKIRMVYLQLLYRCNFECLHCFHGERLKHSDAFSSAEAIRFLILMRDQYCTEAVTLLGGEPFLYKDLPVVVRQARQQLGLNIDATNDHIRKPGSHQSALNALCCARELGVRTGVTTTITSVNIAEVLPLARILEELGVVQLKLHCLRPVGNAFSHPELFIADSTAYMRLREELRNANLDIEIVLDEDLTANSSPAVCAHAGSPREIARIEADPRGALTMSCKAVGKDSHAFWYDKTANRITHRPSATDELTLAVPDVVYARV